MISEAFPHSKNRVSYLFTSKSGVFWKKTGYLQNHPIKRRVFSMILFGEIKFKVAIY